MEVGKKFGNEEAGSDPAPKKKKVLTLTVLVDGTERTLTIPENKVVKIELPKLKKIDIELIKRVVFGYFSRTDNYNNETEFTENKNKVFVCALTKDRGPRTDHGGGRNGDGWMEQDQLDRVAAPYRKKWQPKAGYEATGYFEYGEKGHIAAQFDIIGEAN